MKTTIYVVESNPTLTSLFHDMLTLLDYRVVLCHDVAHLSSWLDQVRQTYTFPGIFLLDVFALGNDPTLFLQPLFQWWQTTYSCSTLPVVFSSTRKVNLGFPGCDLQPFLYKPFRLSQVEAMMQQVNDALMCAHV